MVVRPAALVMWVVCLLANQAFAARPRIAVVPFDSHAGYVRGLDESLAEELSTGFVNLGRFDVFEREKLKKILDEQFKGATGMIDASTAVKLGKVTGVQYIACGTIMDAKCETSRSEYKGKTYYTTEAEVKVNYKVLNAQTGQIHYQESIDGSESESGDVSSESLIRKAAFGTAKEVAYKSRPEIKGKVVRVDEKGFAINIGTSQGVCVDETFVIGQRGKPILDPDSGEVLGYEQGGEMMRARIVKGSAQEKMCYAMPGYWKKVSQPLKLRINSWEWREDKSKLKDIKVGDEVRTVAPEH